MNRKRKETESISKIALERIEILLSRADIIYSKEPELAQRYGELARRIAMKARIRIPPNWRVRFCRNCKKLLFPGVTARVRIKSGHPSRLVYFCKLCEGGKRVRIIIKK